MRTAVFLSALLLTAAPAVAAPAPAKRPPSAKAMLDEAIARTKAMSYRRKQVDWPRLEAQVRAEARGAKDVVDLFPAFQTLLTGLGDHHSFLNISAEDRALYEKRHGHPLPTVAAKRPTSPFMGRRDPSLTSASAGKGTVGVAIVPLHAGGGPKALAYARTLRDGIVGGASGRCGYVVDLRGNGGGNVWPMLLGLSPLLGDYVSQDRRDDGRLHAYARVAGGKATIVDPADPYKGADIIAFDDGAPLPDLSAAPVAVLTDDAVGSSGEGVAVAFAGRPRTRSFGQTTYGIASANEGFVIDDRANLVVTTAMVADRWGRTYPTGLAPDVEVANPSSASDADDPVMARALSWLALQPGCAG